MLTVEEKDLRARIERRHASSLWGQKKFVTPRLVTKVFGDGKQWIWLSSVNVRPAYWVVRIDSSWHIDNWAPSPNPRDWLERVYQAIEEEFGTGEKDDGSLYADARFPQACDLGCGETWGKYELPKREGLGHAVDRAGSMPRVRKASSRRTVPPRRKGRSRDHRKPVRRRRV